MPTAKTCVVCGTPIPKGRTRYCSQKCLRKRPRTRKLFPHVCQCGCGQTFTSRKKVQKYINQKHWAKVNSIRERGKNNPNFKHGLSARDPLTGKQNPQKRKKLSQIYAKYAVTCQNPKCGKTFMVRKTEKNKRKFCSQRCFGILSSKSRKRDKLGRFA